MKHSLSKLYCLYAIEWKIKLDQRKENKQSTCSNNTIKESKKIYIKSKFPN